MLQSIEVVMEVKYFTCKYYDKVEPLMTLGYVFHEELSNSTTYEYIFEYKDGIEKDYENLIRGDKETWDRYCAIKNGSKKINQDLDF